MFNPFYEQYIMRRRQDDFYNRHLLFRLIQKDARAQHTPYYKIPHGFEQLFIFLADKGALLQYSGSPKIAPKRPEEMAKPGSREKAITRTLSNPLY